MNTKILFGILFVIALFLTSVFNAMTMDLWKFNLYSFLFGGLLFYFMSKQFRIFNDKKTKEVKQ